MSSGRTCWDTTVVISPSMRNSYLSWGLRWLFYKVNTSVSSSIGSTLSATGNGGATQKALCARRVYVGKITGADTQVSFNCDWLSKVIQPQSRLYTISLGSIEILSVSAWLVIKSPFCCWETRLLYKIKILLQGTQNSSVSYLTLAFNCPPSRLSPFIKSAFIYMFKNDSLPFQ